LSLIIVSFVVTIISVLIVADNQLTQIIDRSQHAIYAEKVDVIWEELNRTDARLQKTGLVEAYSEDFKIAALKEFRDTYYKRPDQSSYPFILDENFKVVIQQGLSAGDKSIRQGEIGQTILPSERGDFVTTGKDQNQWYIYRRFAPWGWVVVYTVPLELKYVDASALRNMLILVMVGITLIVLLVLSWFITRFTKPIVILTQVSSQISKGDLEQDVALGGNDEVGTLALSFDRMRNSIKCQITDLNKEVGERKKAEKELQKFQNYLTNIIDSMPSMLIGVDPDGKVTQWNVGVELATGTCAEEAVGQPLALVFPRLTSEMKRVHEAIKTRNEQTDLKRPLQKNGELHYEDVTIYPLTANGVEGAVIRVDDVTEQVRLEEMLIQSEKMLSVGGLAAGMAHEINNPLAGMMQTSKVMENRLTSKDIVANQQAAKAAGVQVEAIQAYMEARGILRMLEDINASGLRVVEIVDNMLSFSLKNDAITSSHDLAELLDKTLGLAATDYDLKKQYDFKTINIVREYDANLPLVPCESAKVQQVLLNILRNGSQSMQGLGDNAPTFTLRTYYEPESDTACIEIEDNGPGMDEAIRKRVFEPFFTTKPVGVGTGLGMSVSYFIIVEHHGGEISVESEQGKGARFIIRLPLNSVKEDA